MLVEAILNDPKRIPYGFLGMCPLPGYDPERRDKGAERVSSIFGKEISMKRRMSAILNREASPDNESQLDTSGAYTERQYPVLWPNNAL
jgi:hypothetical protein